MLFIFCLDKFEGIMTSFSKSEKVYNEGIIVLKNILNSRHLILTVGDSMGESEVREHGREYFTAFTVAFSFK